MLRALSLPAVPMFYTVAGSCRPVAGQLPDSCRLFFTQLPSFWSEKSKFCKINPFSNQNDGNCLKNRRQLCKKIEREFEIWQGPSAGGPPWCPRAFSGH